MNWGQSPVLRTSELLDSDLRSIHRGPKTWEKIYVLRPTYNALRENLNNTTTFLLSSKLTSLSLMLMQSTEACHFQVP